jgi:HD-GYP domain-containing protein (c-di-GMP phosphodiesterase class II)
LERSRRAELHRAYLDTVKVLAAAIEVRDSYTWHHVERVTAYTVAIAKEMGWEKERVAHAEMGAALHDVCKIGLEDAVLKKTENLSEAEWAKVKAHPALGAQMLAGVSFLEPAIPYVLYHHERYDGTGYPEGLVGEAIPLEGRVAAVADAFDALTSVRLYRGRVAPEAAMKELQYLAGIQFDPEIVAIFVALWQRGALAAYVGD